MDALLQTLRNLGPLRLTVMSVMSLALVGFLIWAVVRMNKPPMEMMFTELDSADASRIAAKLEELNEPYEVADNGQTIKVPRDKVSELRLALSQEGLAAGSLGYELFDGGSSLGTTNFVQNVTLVRALEGELARTIRGLEAVQSARVHLVLPRREMFSRERMEPTASIILKMKKSSRLSREQVNAIQHLVAAAVPQLIPKSVSVVDERGTLLARGYEEEGSATVTAMKNEERRLAYQRRLTETVENLVANAVGFGKVRAEVNADMSFDRVSTQEEIYDPDGQVVRSTQTIERAANTKEADGTPPVSVATNLPDAGTATEDNMTSSSNESGLEETVNYEISKKVVNHIREGGIVNRLSISVLVDGVYTEDAEGNKTYQPRPADELEKIAALARSAVGFNPNRGDVLEVINMRFAEVEALEEKPMELFMGFDKNDLLDMAEMLVLAIVVILVIVLIGRPLVTRFLEAGPPAPVAMPEGRLLAERAGAPALTGPAPVPMDGMGMEEEESFDELIDIDRVEGRVKASSVKKVGEIVEKHPAEALSIIRSWMYSET